MNGTPRIAECCGDYVWKCSSTQAHAISLPAGAEQRQPKMTHIPISNFFLSVTSKAETFAARNIF